MLLKAIVEGLGGGKKASQGPDALVIPHEATEAMQNAAIAAIAGRAGNRLPIVHGRDPELPREKPVFDIEELRKKNAAINRRRVRK